MYARQLPRQTRLVSNTYPRHDIGMIKAKVTRTAGARCINMTRDSYTAAFQVILALSLSNDVVTLGCAQEVCNFEHLRARADRLELQLQRRALHGRCVGVGVDLLMRAVSTHVMNVADGRSRIYILGSSLSRPNVNPRETCAVNQAGAS